MSGGEGSHRAFEIYIPSLGGLQYKVQIDAHNYNFYFWKIVGQENFVFAVLPPPLLDTLILMFPMFSC